MKPQILSLNIFFFASISEFYRILSIVRNKILDWALLLEENGIIGEDLNFSEFEKKSAKETPIINNYTNNFFSDVSGVDLQQGNNTNPKFDKKFEEH